mmetsp:Transcript_9492/g.14246  ORF Transcript_9492/g.14246 Transcript_9492/m.14246 type:complete len:87 (-) Transcript_9492:253-513(-)
MGMIEEACGKKGFSGLCITLTMQDVSCAIVLLYTQSYFWVTLSITRAQSGSVNRKRDDLLWQCAYVMQQFLAPLVPRILIIFSYPV